VGLGVDAVRQEALEQLAAPVDDAERRVLRARQLRGGVDELLENGVERELRRQGDSGLEQGTQTILCLDPVAHGDSLGRWRRARTFSPTRRDAYIREEDSGPGGARVASELDAALAGELLRATLEAALDCVIVIDERGTIVEFNAAAERVFGHPRDAAIGTELAALVIPPALRERHRAGLARHLETGESTVLGRRIELTALRADGQEFPVELTVTRARESPLFVGYVRDLTPQQRAERRLAAQHEVTRILAEAESLDEAAPRVLATICQSLRWELGCLWRVDDDGVAMDCFGLWRDQLAAERPAFEKLTRRLRFEQGVGLPGRVWVERRPLWIPDMGAERAFPRSAAADEEGLHAAFGFPIQLGDAVLGVVEFFSPESRPPDEDLLRMMESLGSQLAQFIARTNAAELLSRSEESYRLLFEQHPSPMWVYDPESLRFLTVNEAAVDRYRFTREEFLGMTIDQIRPPEDVGALRQLIADAERQRVNAGVWRHRTKDGRDLDVLVTSTAIEFQGRRARLVLAQDVTEQRRLEEQLRQAQKMEAVGRLAGGVAHDFNNLLTVILGYGDAARKATEVGGIHASVDEMVRAARSCADLTRRLLAFSRQQVLQPRVVDLGEVVSSVEGLLRRTLGEDVEVQVEVAPGTGRVRLDPVQMEQVLLNLAINARDAMPYGGALRIEATDTQVDEAFVGQHVEVTPGRYVLVSVSDTGQGMDAETRARAFDPFFTTKVEGTGLGLSTVYGIVRQSGGHIWLYSEPGAGTTFRMVFPTVDEPVDRSEPSGEHVWRGGGETILVVEDSEAVRRLIVEALDSGGYRVLEAADAEEALRVVAGGARIDLVLTDLVLPGSTGPDLVDRLRDGGWSPRVLYTSGYARGLLQDRLGLEPGQPFLAKPFTLDTLAQQVRRALDA
jgi:two-component system, cell cycle sensor histidine kinase and response regulator CckA